MVISILGGSLISLTTLMLYTFGAAILIISPGPDFLYVTTRGIAQGRKAGILSAAGISIGLLVHTVLAALGLSALLQTSGFLFQAVKFTGAAYLIYLGIKAFLSKESIIQQDVNSIKLDGITIFRQGVLTNVFNPKAIITFMAFIPQFINPVDGNASFQIIILGAVIAFLAIVWFGIVGYFAGTLGGWLSTKSSVKNTLRWITSSILIGLGLRLAFSKK